MMKKAVRLFVALLFPALASAQQPLEVWMADEGGSGTHKAMMALYGEMPGCVVCRPFNLTAAAAKTSLPVVLFQTDGEDASRYERFINP